MWARTPPGSPALSLGATGNNNVPLPTLSQIRRRMSNHGSAVAVEALAVATTALSPPLGPAPSLDSPSSKENRRSISSNTQYTPGGSLLKDKELLSPKVLSAIGAASRSAAMHAATTTPKSAEKKRRSSSSASKPLATIFDHLASPSASKSGSSVEEAAFLDNETSFTWTEVGLRYVAASGHTVTGTRGVFTANKSNLTGEGVNSVFWKGACTPMTAPSTRQVLGEIRDATNKRSHDASVLEVREFWLDLATTRSTLDKSVICISTISSREAAAASPRSASYELTFASAELAKSAMEHVFEGPAKSIPARRASKGSRAQVNNRRRSIAFDDIEEVMEAETFALAETSAPSEPPEPAASASVPETPAAEKPGDLASMIREFVRTNDASLAARIEAMSSYPLLPEFEPETPGTLAARKQARRQQPLLQLTQAQLLEQRNLVVSVRRARAEDKKRLQDGARVLITSPSRGQPLVVYRCSETGDVIEPRVYESRYRELERLPRHPSPAPPTRPAPAMPREWEGLDEAKRLFSQRLSEEERILHARMDEAIDHFVRRKAALEKEFKDRFPHEGLEPHALRDSR